VEDLLARRLAAALIADWGKDVVLVEKDAHPRFHIGESLLPPETSPYWKGWAFLKKLA